MSYTLIIVIAFPRELNRASQLRPMPVHAFIYRLLATISVIAHRVLLAAALGRLSVGMNDCQAAQANFNHIFHGSARAGCDSETIIVLFILETQISWSQYTRGDVLQATAQRLMRWSPEWRHRELIVSWRVPKRGRLYLDYTLKGFPSMSTPIDSTSF